MANTRGKREQGAISIVQIAELAGVSIATVSRVLNKTGRYSAETEAKVLRLVEEHGYTPNANAQSLRTKKTNCIAVVVPDIANEFFAKLVRSIELAALPKGYSVFVCDTQEKPELENLHLQNLMAKNVDGMIYISGKQDVSGLEIASHIPVVYIDRHPENAPVIVQSDNKHGGFLATEELIKKGCKKILFLQDYHWLSTLRHRLKGYMQAHEKYSVPVNEELIIQNVPGYVNSKAIVKMFVQNGLDFDGIFASNDNMALGALHALLEEKIKVPEQVKVIGFDDVTLSMFCEVPLSTVQQDTNAMGVKSLEQLERLMQGKRPEQQNCVIPVSLVVRSSTR